ncbi:MAG TPA: hypothetical protein DDW52_11550 [Planctomycetaceae bacterium]|nr:hypothetical protein [Planctomycetaceae bacterium]
MSKWDFENTSLVVLGAGFSFAATDGGTPLMKGYFDRLDKAVTLNFTSSYFKLVAVAPARR